MGSLENASRKRTRKGQIERAVLGTLVVAGAGMIALAAPNMMRLLKHVDPDWILKRDPKQRLREVAYRLKKKGFVTFEKEAGKTRMLITEKGRQEIQRTLLRQAQDRPMRWDGKWRIVIFDIPEKKRILRQQVRTHVQEFGFKRLQNSVWVYPYDCEELITLIKSDLRLGTSLLYIIADAIEFDAPLKKRFNL